MQQFIPSTNSYHRLTIIGLLVFLLFVFPSCKKDKGSPEPPIPQFGTCVSTPVKGSLTKDAEPGAYTYRTKGGGTIKFSIKRGFVITHDDYTNFTIDLWGDLTVNGETRASANHENLNGKHIKDRFDARRTIIFPDGTKLTYLAKAYVEELLWVSIYEGSEVHHINATCNTVEYSNASDADMAKLLDDAEADGEAGGFEITTTGLMYFNSYMEDTPGNKIYNRVDLGELVRSQPSVVKDLYDDPRIGHTRAGK